MPACAQILSPSASKSVLAELAHDAPASLQTRIGWSVTLVADAGRVKATIPRQTNTTREMSFIGGLSRSKVWVAFSKNRADRRARSHAHCQLGTRLNVTRVRVLSPRRLTTCAAAESASALW